MKNLEKLVYWINERESIRVKKEQGLEKPWSDDLVFQRTYFCNIDREDDRVTRWIRQRYSPWVGHRLFVHNIILSRFLNWPDTLDALDYQQEWRPNDVKETLNIIKDRGAKVWGNAYVVTTHGIPMDKIDYLCDRVMPSIDNVLDKRVLWGGCSDYARVLQKIEGISTFMAGQVVADLKNTPGYPLQDAPDWWTFALPGPGSVRGMDWLYGEKVKSNFWLPNLMVLQEVLRDDYNFQLCAQNIQNCLCEFDKYLRVSTGSGRSKRGYLGA